jgi:hypothetical protein
VPISRSNKLTRVIISTEKYHPTLPSIIDICKIPVKVDKPKRVADEDIIPYITCLFLME